MLLWMRFLSSLARHYFLPKQEVGAPITSSFRVYPFDCDLVTLNSSRFLQFCEISQHCTNFRVGFLGFALRKKWYAVIRSQYIVYLKPIKIFSRFQVTSTNLGWDERYSYWRDELTVKGRLCAIHYSKVMVRDGAGMVSPKAAFEAMGLPFPDRRPPADIAAKLATPEEAQS